MQIQVFQPSCDFVEVSWNEGKSTLVVFDYDLPKKSILIGDEANSIELPNCTIVYQINENPILHGGEKYLLCTAKDREFFVTVHDVDKSNGGKQYTHARDSFTAMKFDKALMTHSKLYILIMIINQECATCKVKLR